ncbi:MAG: hypothetical protein ACKO37_00375 [Vampirovibrionales bacterium]
MYSSHQASSHSTHQASTLSKHMTPSVQERAGFRVLKRYGWFLKRALAGEFLSNTERVCLSGLMLFLVVQLIAVWVFHQNFWMTYQPQPTLEVPLAPHLLPPTVVTDTAG